jgi:general secretion pathway protein A
MDYFRILNLKKEPFSNSPEPEFFFQSDKHLECLQKLELAIRLRRGLSIVIGDVGTGKTTLCRQLILKFAGTEEDRKQIETYLLLDPSFTNSLEFLTTVALTFGLARPEDHDTEWHIKENIKNYLFSKGVDESKIVVLIIDEGQKLPDFCLEILREFLNYETNEFKLLQIVIFAQNEFKQVLNRYNNFTDRVNFYYHLKPMNFQETRGMIKYRIGKASDVEKAPSLFTYPGLWALYRVTGGYPRKIVTLCHQVILSLIIQNKSIAGWFLVRSCAQRNPMKQRKFLKWTAAIAVALMLIAASTIRFYPEMVSLIGFSNTQVKSVQIQNVTPVMQTVKSESAVGTNTTAMEATIRKQPEKQNENIKMPKILGELKLKEKRTIWWMLTDFYGNFNDRQLKAIANANPHIKNLNRVWAGEVIRLPAVPVQSNPLPQGKYLIQIAKSEDIDKMYELYKKYLNTLPSLKFLPYWNAKDGLLFAIFMSDGYPDLESAQSVVKKLPQKISREAQVLSKLDDKTVFFTR